MSNRKTHEADHNELAMSTILSDFREQRMHLVDRLDNLNPQAFAAVAHHPRLNVPMRLVDMLFFQAEHDDYHLARISEVIRLFVELVLTGRAGQAHLPPPHKFGGLVLFFLPKNFQEFWGSTS